jgi:predicted RNA-binding Zn-ribbon protein involved in translation (DUF1610 family)
MSQGVELVPLQCVRCSTPVRAGPDEVAWVCANCGQGLLLDGESGLRALEVKYAAAAQQEGLVWRPFWVAAARVTFQARETYGHDRGPDEIWGAPQMFILPAFECSLEEAGAWGMGFLRQPPRLVEGPAGLLEGVTVDPQAARALAEFVVLTVEAERRDQLRSVAFDLDLEPPVLWAMPFTNESGTLRLALAG